MALTPGGSFGIRSCCRSNTRSTHRSPTSHGDPRTGVRADQWGRAGAKVGNGDADRARGRRGGRADHSTGPDSAGSRGTGRAPPVGRPAAGQHGVGARVDIVAARADGRGDGGRVLGGRGGPAAVWGTRGGRTGGGRPSARSGSSSWEGPERGREDRGGPPGRLRPGSGGHAGVRGNFPQTHRQGTSPQSGPVAVRRPVARRRRGTDGGFGTVDRPENRPRRPVHQNRHSPSDGSRRSRKTKANRPGPPRDHRRTTPSPHADPPACSHSAASGHSRGGVTGAARLTNAHRAFRICRRGESPVHACGLVS